MSKKQIRKLKDVHFDFDTAHLAYTDGAASLKDEPYLLKSLEVVEDATDQPESDNQAHACEDENVDRSTTENPTSKENKMTDVNKELQDQIAQMQHELAVQKAVNSLNKYGLNAELSAPLADALADLDADKQEAVFKAFDAFVAAKDEAVQKAVSEAKTTAEADKNPIEKAMDSDKEVGAEEVVEKSDKELTLAEKIAQYQDQGAK